ncbi:MAG: hypothetical protein EOO88_18890, partial [Pedobacter sp.]
MVATSCDQGKSKGDINPDDDPSALSTPTAGVPLTWLPTTFQDATGKLFDISVVDLSSPSGVTKGMKITQAQANLPLSIFTTGDISNPDFKSIPFLAFHADPSAKVTIRHVKTLEGKVIDNDIVTPMGCPNIIPSETQTGEKATSYCIPMISSAMKKFVVPTDLNKIAIHEFTISSKIGAAPATFLATRTITETIIPGGTLTVTPSDAIKALKLVDRLSMVTNDLRGTPRRDFIAFNINNSTAPGVETAWIVKLDKVKMMIMQDVFYEQPIAHGETATRPLITRGGAFYKRRAFITSDDQFRLKLFNLSESTPISA